MVQLAVRTVCQYHSLVNYALVQLRRKRTLHWNNIPNLHTKATDEQFFVSSPSHFSVSTSSPYCHVILRQHATFHRYRITRGRDMTSHRFLKWRLLWHNFTSGFRLGDVTFFRRSMSISTLNIVGITRSVAEI